LAVQSTGVAAKLSERQRKIVYDDCQHLDLFHGPGRYLFRGTLPSNAFAAAYQGSGVTPTSVDPIVATLFACRYRVEGPAGVLIALKSALAELLDGPNLASFWYELAVNIELLPYEFEGLCLQFIPVGESLAVLKQLGYRLPSKLPDLGALTQALVQSPRMPMEDIDRYVELCQRFSEGG
jgi:large repetitive protein